MLTANVMSHYLRIGPKKLIIRQGHKAQQFYFILSGTGRLLYAKDTRHNSFTLYCPEQVGYYTLRTQGTTVLLYIVRNR